MSAERDRARKYLVPTARLDLPDQPDVVHLSVYEWLPGFEAWATGIGLCGYSTTQGALPQDTEVTCASCLGYRATYEEALNQQDAPVEATITVPESEFGQLLAVATLYLDAFTDDERMSYVEAARHGEVAAIVEKYGRRS